MLVEQWDIVGVRHCERMVSSHKALLLVAPLEEREVDNPQALELVLVAQTETVAHLKTQSAELNACLVGVVARENENKVAILSTHCFLNLCEYLWGVELVYRRLHCAVSVELDVNQALCAYLRTLYEVGNLIELLACVVSATRYADTANILSLMEYRECARALQYVHELYELHAETQVGLVATETAHSLVPCHLLQLSRQLNAAYFLEQMASHILEEVDNVVLVNERHLAVDLSKLWLTVCTQILVAETLCNLEVAVETTDHEQLLQSLRALRESVELSGVHA